MYSVVVTDTIAIAHRLPGIPTCERLHGHNLTFEIKVSSEFLNDKGMVVNFQDIKSVIRSLDHQYLNDLLSMEMPTAENIAKWIYDRLSKITSPALVDYVKVWESDKAFVEYWE